MERSQLLPVCIDCGLMEILHVWRTVVIHTAYYLYQVRKKPLVSFAVLNLATVEFRRHCPACPHRNEYVAPEANII